MARGGRDIARIPEGVITSPRFAGHVRINAAQNALFPHHDEKGLCGLEKENRGFAGFGGEKGLWLSSQFPDDNALVICERAIECLSYAALHPYPHYRFASIAGRTNPKQPSLIRFQVDLLLSHGGDAVIAAMNHDEAGYRLSAELLGICEGKDVMFFVQTPDHAGTDWNDALKERRR